MPYVRAYSDAFEQEITPLGNGRYHAKVRRRDKDQWYTGLGSSAPRARQVAINAMKLDEREVFQDA